MNSDLQGSLTMMKDGVVEVDPVVVAPAEDCAVPAEIKPKRETKKRKPSSSATSAAADSSVETEASETAPVASAVDADSSPSSEVVSATTQTPVKRVKKEKDPFAPKRPLNAFFLFQRDHRVALKSAHPTVTPHELSRLLSEAWEKASPDAKRQYEADARRFYEEYSKDMTEYRNRALAAAESKDDEPMQTSEGERNAEEPKKGYNNDDAGDDEEVNTSQLVFEKENCSQSSVSNVADLEGKEKRRRDRKEKKEKKMEAA